MTARPTVKICGVTRPRDAVLAADLGADYLGLNFYPRSPRYVTPERAAEIAAPVRGRVGLVGVFVGSPAAEIEAVDRAVGLDLLQFHGDEPWEEIAPFRERAVKVFRLRERFDPAWLEGDPGVWGFLFDCRHSILWGGTGEGWRYERVADLPLPDRPRWVAGGVGPGTALAALRRSRATGVDVCSGVESEPGVKAPDLLEALFREVIDGTP